MSRWRAGAAQAGSREILRCCERARRGPYNARVVLPMGQPGEPMCALGFPTEQQNVVAGTMKRCRTLLTWVGAQDPWRPQEGRKSRGLEPFPPERPPGHLDGPVLTLLANAEPFDALYVLCNPKLRSLGALDALQRELAARFPTLDVRPREVPIDDPRAYEPLYRHMRAVCEEARAADPDAEFHVLLSPGTPQMHAVWVLLAKTVFPAIAWQTSDVPGCAPAEPARIPFDVDAELVEPARAEARPQPEDIPGLVCRSDAMRKVLGRLRRTASYDATILLLGETGVGKTKLARFIHDASPRSKGPFVTVDCTTLPPPLAESELFGHERGAFTGAARRRQGLFDAASGGTAFIDEIGELPLDLQGKLLRVIERRSIRRVGSDCDISVDVRIVAATNRDLREMVTAGKFRQDLFFRLRGTTVLVPPLRDRREDIPSLAQAFLDRENGKRVQRRESPLHLTKAAARLLNGLPWHGNVREIELLVESLAIQAEPETIRLAVDDFVAALSTLRGDSLTTTLQPGSLRLATADFQRKMISQALERWGTQSEAARALGLNSAQSLQNRMRTLRMR